MYFLQDTLPLDLVSIGQPYLTEPKHVEMSGKRGTDEAAESFNRKSDRIDKAIAENRGNDVQIRENGANVTRADRSNSYRNARDPHGKQTTEKEKMPP
jgi:hypothetical protein